jgi:N-acetylglucosamine-6-phosphate deacetylase
MRTAFTGPRIFDGHRWHDPGTALVVEDGRVVAPASGDVQRIELEGGLLVPGFVDLQVNGGGGVQLNESPDVGTIATI